MVRHVVPGASIKPPAPYGWVTVGPIVFGELEDEAHGCGLCGFLLIRGPIEGCIDSTIVFQCPACGAYNQAASGLI